MTLSVKGEVVFRGAASREDTAELMREALECLLNEGMTYLDEADSGLHELPPGLDLRLADAGVLLEDNVSPYVLMLEPRYSPQEKYHFLTVRSGSDLEVDELATEWGRLTLRLRQLIETTRPTAAIAFGIPSGGEDEPNLQNLALGLRPMDLANWTYFANELLEKSLSEKLEKVPGAKIEALHSGKIIQLGALPGQPFSAAVAGFRFESELRFFDPMVKRDD